MQFPVLGPRIRHDRFSLLETIIKGNQVLPSSFHTPVKRSSNGVHQIEGCLLFLRLQIIFVIEELKVGFNSLCVIAKSLDFTVYTSFSTSTFEL